VLKSRTASAELNSRLALNASQIWLDEAVCGGLVMWRDRIVMIGFQRVDVFKLMEQEIEAGVGSLGMSV